MFVIARLAFLAVVTLVFAVSCSMLGANTTTTTIRTTTTMSEFEKSLEGLEETVEEAELLIAWLKSEENRLAKSQWRSNVQAAMAEYLIFGFSSGEIPPGDCPIGNTGISIDCIMIDFANDELQWAFERSGNCPDYLEAFGCRPSEYYTESVRERWYEENG